MTRETRRSLEREIEELGDDDGDEELTGAELWRMYINGELSPDHPAMAHDRHREPQEE